MAAILHVTLLAAVLFASASGCQLPIGLGATPVTGVALNKDSLTLAIGGSETLVAAISPSRAVNKAVTWTSSNANVTVSSAGLVTAVSAGSAVVTVTTMEGSFTATCQVTVTASVPVTGVSLDRHSATLPYGKTLQLAASVLPSNATNKSVTWSSSGASATVSSGGLVTASALGSANITVRTVEGAFTDACSISVIPAVSLSKTTDALAAGHSDTLVATVAPASAPNKAVTWTTSNSDIVAVVDGTILAISAGTATITATAVDGSNAATCVVTVTGSLAHTYSEVLPAANALQNGLNAALQTDDSTATAYCAFVTDPSWLVTCHLNGYVDSFYTINGTVVGQVKPDYTVGTMNGVVTLTGGVVTRIEYINAVFAQPRSGSVAIMFNDGASGTLNLATGAFTPN